MVGTEQVGGASGDCLEVGEPGDAGGVEPVWFYVGVGRDCADVVGFGMSVQQGGHLASGDWLFRAELPVGITKGALGASSGDFVGDGPPD